MAAHLPETAHPLVGRDDAIAAVERLLLLPATRLVTIIGPGGVGKTALATHLLASLAPDYPDGTAFVQLAPVRDPGLVLLTIARVLDVREQAHTPIFDRLVAELSGRRMLLGLDNLEHLLPAAPEIAELLEACPGLKILATSRAPLNLRAEHRFPLGTLDISATAGDEVSPAVSLFVERARRVQWDFALNAENRGDVEAICRGLDGLPLAIELAAARLSLLTPAALRARLDHQLRILSGGPADLPPRLRSMADAIGWSYDLLEPIEQTVCRRLAVFFGGWTLEAAEAVCGFGDVMGEQVLTALGVLLDNSLIRRVPSADAEPRFGMLETVREFGLEQLVSLGELSDTREAHAVTFLELTERSQPELEGPNQGEWLDRLEVELDNLRGAANWYFESGNTESSLRLVAALHRFWDTRDYMVEGRGQVARVVALPGANRYPLLTALAHDTAGELALWTNDGASARESVAAAIETWRAIGDERHLIVSLQLSSVANLMIGDVQAAARDVTALLSLSPELLGPEPAALALMAEAGYAYYGLHDLDRGSRLFERAAEACASIGNLADLAAVLAYQAEVAFDQGAFVASLALWEQSLPLARRTGEDWNLAWYLEGIAALRVAGGQPAAAARLLGAAQAWRTKREAPVLSNIMIGWRVDGMVRHALGSTADAFIEQGRTLSLEDAIAEAQAGAVPAPPDLPSQRTLKAGAHGLTAREAEIAALLARRLTDREIADVLVISPRTVTTHVAAILGKLGVASRRDVAAALNADE